MRTKSTGLVNVSPKKGESKGVRVTGGESKLVEKILAVRHRIMEVRNRSIILSDEIAFLNGEISELPERPFKMDAKKEEIYREKLKLCSDAILAAKLEHWGLMKQTELDGTLDLMDERNHRASIGYLPEPKEEKLKDNDAEFEGHLKDFADKTRTVRFSETVTTVDGLLYADEIRILFQQKKPGAGNSYNSYNQCRRKKEVDMNLDLIKEKNEKFESPCHQRAEELFKLKAKRFSDKDLHQKVLGDAEVENVRWKLQGFNRRRGIKENDVAELPGYYDAIREMEDEKARKYKLSQQPVDE
ncbi:hypothetical protein [Kistimonas asteriae]|uniref:hypothetical protein n=1 Tax=Kistimonas asteriae TaxID=517724 RepID=UPI001BA7DC36|nr:hypothetical protein [Kistimonas asteriae]